MKNVDEKKRIARIVVVATLVVAIVLLLFFLFKDFILEILRLTKAHDDDGLKEFMSSKGWFGYIAVVFVETLEMIVVFIPAEFIQTPAGLSFPFYIALILCDIGVFIGASIIYLLVNTFKIETPYLKEREKKIKSIERMSSGAKNQTLMYLLFVTPIIPFGAICYYFSSKNISYRRYILTCVTGVIPSIVSSALIGTGIKYLITHDMSVWILILIILAVIILLLFFAYLIGRKFLFKEEYKNTPMSVLYNPILSLLGFYSLSHSKPKYVYDELYHELIDIESPVLIVCNHLSKHDIYHAFKFIYPLRAALVGNRYYMRIKATRFIMKKMGFIPKRLFSTELEPISKMLKYLHNGTSVFVYPEARLSLDGTTNPIIPGVEALAKKANVPLVILNLRGTYLAGNKVHKESFRVPVEARVKKIIYQEELNKLSDEGINNIIQENLNLNEFEYSKKFVIKGNRKANGYENLIYKCPKCHKEYSLKAVKNKLVCDCGFELEFDEHNNFKENEFNFKNIHDAYQYIKNLEAKEIEDKHDVIYQEEVNAVLMNLSDKKKDKKGDGVTTIKRDGFYFEGTINGEKVKFFNSIKNLRCLAFSLNDEYECYFNGDLYYFYPKINKKSCTKVSTIYDIVQEKYGEK